MILLTLRRSNSLFSWKVDPHGTFHAPNLTNAFTPAQGEQGNTSLIDGVRKFVNVRDLNIDLIDRINPFDAAYAVLAKAMDERVLRQVQASISAKRVAIPYEEAKALALRARAFMAEKLRPPDINSSDPWERKMAEGVVALGKHVQQRKAAQGNGEADG